MSLLAVSLALTACKKKETAPTAGSDMASGAGMASGSAATGSAATGSGSAMAGSGSAMTGSADSGSAMTGSAGSGSDAGSAAANTGSGAGSGSGSDATAVAMAHKAGMCPSTVFGSTTKVATKGKSVEVTIASDDKDAVIAIQKRTTESLKEKVEGSSGPGGPGHDQKGTHGGGIGLCPVHVPAGAAATAKAIVGKGMVITITPKDPKDVDALKTDIDGRVVKAADWVKANIKPGDNKNQGGDGGGKGPHGSNHTGNGDGTGSAKKAK